jgi:hypothetical protein
LPQLRVETQVFDSPGGGRLQRILNAKPNLTYRWSMHLLLADC